MLFISMQPAIASLEWRYGNEELRYVTGGVGQEERSAMRSQFPETDLKIVNLEDGSGAYLANATITIVDANGDNLLQTVSEGPWFFVDLKPGTYRIKSVVGSSEQERTIKVGATRVREVTFRWVRVKPAERPFPMPEVPLPGEPLPVEPETKSQPVVTKRIHSTPEQSGSEKPDPSVEIDFDNANPITGPKKTEAKVAKPQSDKQVSPQANQKIDASSPEPLRLPPTETDDRPFRQAPTIQSKPEVKVADESCNPPPDKILEADCLFR